ncbi:unnamed protein product [Sphenostylis stenocarpa]|uniref:Uncharacterized protein n=1 Tax=Sphenostylis stenocarpa TaxID=92480 RepID=A0AA86SEI5_9FABA|nr:unnamed protein product [Sphenostylis stenocarpa]
MITEFNTLTKESFQNSYKPKPKPNPYSRSHLFNQEPSRIPNSATCRNRNQNKKELSRLVSVGSTTDLGGNCVNKRNSVKRVMKEEVSGVLSRNKLKSQETKERRKERRVF